ncbi:hypothetical protein [Mariniflexile sp.]|uniref:hypothetical protein n=1 Tax=Mariniflexile sp. TaxID=1979402 RepID=UPI00404840A7
MAKLFNNIRKSLLNQGKTTNYLKYAIGEIVFICESRVKILQLFSRDKIGLCA